MITLQRIALWLGAMVTMASMPSNIAAQSSSPPPFPNIERVPQSETVREPLGLPEDLNGAQLKTLFDLFAVQEDIKPLLTALLKELMVYGEPQPSWFKEGIFLPDLLARQGGNVSDQILVSKGYPASIQRFGGKPPEAAKEMRSFELSKGNISASSEITTVKLTSDVWLEVSASFTRKGNALCYEEFERMRLLSKSDPSEWSAEEFGVVGLFYAMTSRVQSIPMCLVYHQHENGQVEAIAHSPDGRPMTELNAQKMRLSLLPESDSKELMRTLKAGELFGDGN